MIFQKVVICIHIYHGIQRSEVIFGIDFEGTKMSKCNSVLLEPKCVICGDIWNV